MSGYIACEDECIKTATSFPPDTESSNQWLMICPNQDVADSDPIL